jgi:hypothetical protein
MDYDAVLAQVLDLLQQEQRLSYRALKRRLQLVVMKWTRPCADRLQ